MSNETDILDYLRELDDQGLSIDELAEFNDLADGFTKTLGLRFTMLNKNEVRGELPVSAAHLQPSGIVNGGVFSSLAETAGSIAGLIASGGKNVVGVNCNTDFLAPVAAGVIDLRAEVIRNGTTTQLVAIDMFHRDRLVARSTLRTMVLDRPKKAPKKDKFAE
ncbi:MAG: PaaI family thioesterase [Corynebacterium sp.]|nr:PaaI family thioesterase [Corynebacterium sp.]